VRWHLHAPLSTAATMLYAGGQRNACVPAPRRLAAAPLLRRSLPARPQVSCWLRACTPAALLAAAVGRPLVDTLLCAGTPAAGYIRVMYAWIDARVRDASGVLLPLHTAHMVEDDPRLQVGRPRGRGYVGGGGVGGMWGGGAGASRRRSKQAPGWE